MAKQEGDFVDRYVIGIAIIAAALLISAVIYAVANPPEKGKGYCLQNWKDIIPCYNSYTAVGLNDTCYDAYYGASCGATLSICNSGKEYTCVQNVEKTVTY